VVIGSAIVAALDRLKLKFPKVDKASLRQFAEVRAALEHEGNGGNGRGTAPVPQAPATAADGAAPPVAEVGAAHSREKGQGA